jgi:hypothetical protein
MIMNKPALALLSTILTLAGATAASAADLITNYPEQDERNGVKIGYLTCDIGGGNRLRLPFFVIRRPVRPL